MPRQDLAQLPYGFCNPHGDATPTARAYGTGARVDLVPGVVVDIEKRYFMGKAVYFYEGPSGNHCVVHLGFASAPTEYTQESLDDVERMRREAAAGRARSGTLTYECPKPIKGATAVTEYVRHARREFADLAHAAQLDPATGKPNWTKDYTDFADWPGSNVFVFQRAAKATPNARADPRRFVALGRFAVTAASTPAVLALRPVGPEAPPPADAADTANLATLAALAAKKRASPAPTIASSASPSSSSIDWDDSDDSDDSDDRGRAAAAKRPRSAA